MQKACKSCRSRQELSNVYLLAKIGVDTAENEPLKVHLIFKLWDLILTDPAGLPRGAGARAVHVGGVRASSGWRPAVRIASQASATESPYV